MSLPGSHHAACKILGNHIPPRITRSIRSSDMSTKHALVPSSDETISRRGFFMKLGILFNGLHPHVTGWVASFACASPAPAFLSLTALT